MRLLVDLPAMFAVRSARSSGECGWRGANKRAASGEKSLVRV